MVQNYQKLNPLLLRKLEGILGKDNLLSSGDPGLTVFARDEISGYGDACFAIPEAVAFPDSEQKIVELVELANRHHFPITPRGGGTGLAGGAVPVFGGLVVSLEKMNRIIEIDPQNLTVTTQPGVIVKTLNDHLAGDGLTFPCFPISQDRCQIGGNVATNAGGGKAVKYGVTGRYVLGMRVVSPTGRVLALGGKLLKNATGYNLIPLVTGSEGTLGIITELTIKVISLPTVRRDFLALFPCDEAALGIVSELLAGTGIVPASIEYIDHLSIKVTERFLGKTLNYRNCGAALIFSFDGYDRQTVDSEYDRAATFVRARGALGVEEGKTPASRERLWMVRKNLADAFHAYSPFQTCEDIVVPPGRMMEVFIRLRRIADEYGVAIPIFGHAGDGNLHPRIVAPADWSAEKWHEIFPKVQKAIFHAAADCGGQISGEHGIGRKRRSQIFLTVPENNLEWMRNIKTVLDPNRIMNPGKIF